jgi:hypothetical protein
VPGHSGGADRPEPGEETQDNRHAGAVESQATSEVAAPMEGRQKTTGPGSMMKGL